MALLFSIFIYEEGIYHYNILNVHLKHMYHFTIIYWFKEIFLWLNLWLNISNILISGKWKSLTFDSLWPHGLYIVHGILQARILEWVAFLFSMGSSQTWDWTQVSCIAGGFLTSWVTYQENGSVVCLLMLVYHLVVSNSLQPYGCDPMDCSPPGSSAHGFSRQEYWMGCSILLQGIFPSPGLNPCHLCFLHCQADYLPLSHLGSPYLLTATR